MTNKLLLHNTLLNSSFGRMTFQALCRNTGIRQDTASRYLKELRLEGKVSKERMGMNTVFKVKESVDWGTKEIEIV